jgi:hypothetical protein
MWKIYYIKKIINKFIENSITLSIFSKITNKQDIINILSNINVYKQFILNSDVKKIYNEIYCNGMIFNCVFISNDKYYEIYIFSNSEKKLFIKELTKYEYDNYDEFTENNFNFNEDSSLCSKENSDESYKFGYDIWEKDDNVDFSYYIDKLDWSSSLDLFYNLNSYKMMMNKDNVDIQVRLKTITLDKIMDKELFSQINAKVCFFNKIKSNCSYYFNYTFLIKLINNNIIVIDIIDEDNIYDGYSITLKVIEYNNINEYFQTKNVDIYYKTFGYDIKNIINYEYYIP